MAEVNEHLHQNIEDLAVLWPYLNMAQKFEWWDNLRDEFDDDMTLFIQTMTNMSEGRNA